MSHLNVQPEQAAQADYEGPAEEEQPALDAGASVPLDLFQRHPFTVEDWGSAVVPYLGNTRSNRNATEKQLWGRWTGKTFIAYSRVTADPSKPPHFRWFFTNPSTPEEKNANHLSKLSLKASENNLYAKMTHKPSLQLRRWNIVSRP